MTWEAEPLKADRLGQVRTSRGKREEILDEFERSGVSGAEFARLTGIRYPTLANWVQRRARSKASPPIRFVGAEMSRSVPLVPALELELPGGVRLRLLEAAQVPLAVQLLRSLGSC